MHSKRKTQVYSILFISIKISIKMKKQREEKKKKKSYLQHNVDDPTEDLRPEIVNRHVLF